MAGQTEQSEFSRGDVEQWDEVRAARAYGIDVPALAANVARSCTERVMRHQAALACAEKLRKARRL
ncbi:MAG: hypothetical protein ACYTEL_16185 [Planctomycetota bacterium]